MSKLNEPACACTPKLACSCPPNLANGKYGEEETLQAMEKFRQFYEDKLRQIDIDGGGDCTELKLKLQERWIKDLTEQTEMMARIVKELEEEATTRVRMLEDKLKQTSKAAYEVMKRYQTYNITHNLDEPFQKLFYLENDLKNVLEFVRRIREDNKWSIDGLQFYDVSYCDLFGKNNCDDECKNMSKLSDFCNGLDCEKESQLPVENEQQQNYEELLKKKNEEYEALRQSMLDMRSALTEEVACKHDMILALKRDVLHLEERCVQADKQTAFKDDIIKELRKEIKQLKQQLKREGEEKKSEEVQNLEEKLKEAEEKICRMRPCVDTKSACTAMDDLLEEKEEELRREIYRRQVEVEELKAKIEDLENTLKHAQARGENLQKAVDLYLNSINVLEASEEKSRIEIEQQRVTINNLQDALVSAKHELDELRQKNQQEVQNQQYIINVLYINLLDFEDKYEGLSVEKSQLIDSYKRLQDCNFELEVEHFNSLQDIALLETQLHKYQNEFRNLEEARNLAKSELKKLRQQKRCYEHVLGCFKQEMSVMSEQLVNLQDLLKLSNQSCKEENGQLYNAIADISQVCDRLKAELRDAEKKIFKENQRNQLKDMKIGELQSIISMKNADLEKHDEAINEMKGRLEAAYIENHQFQTIAAGLRARITELECELKSKELETRSQQSRPRSADGNRSIDDLKVALERKERKLSKLEREYVAQHDVLKSLQTEFDKVRDKNKEKVKSLKRQNEEIKAKLEKVEKENEELKAKLEKSERRNQKIAEEFKVKLEKAERKNLKMVEELVQVKEETSKLFKKDSNRDQELIQSRQIIIELRQNLIDLNENLANSEFQQMALAEEFYKKIQEERQHEDIFFNCRCEIALYRKLAQNLKDMLMKTRKDLADMEAQHKTLQDEVKHKEVKLIETQKKVARKEREAHQNVKELTEQLRRSQEEEKKLRECVHNLKSQLEEKEKNQCHCLSTKDEMAATQEEINALKTEIKRMIQNQLSLNSENDKLLKQVASMQNSHSVLDEKNRYLKQKIEKLQSDNQKLRETTKSLQREKEHFLGTIRSLEAELADVRSNWDDICAESKYVVTNVKAWLEEQKKINDNVKKKAQGYRDTISKLRMENENLQNRSSYTPPSILKSSKTCKSKFRSYSPPPPHTNLDHVDSYWCYDSQGNDTSRDSPASFLTCSVDEWYSPNYRDETDFESDHEDDFVTRLEAVALEMKNSNKKWREKYKECDCSMVSRDDK